MFVVLSGTVMMGVGLGLVLWQLDSEREQALDDARVEIAQRAYTLDLYLQPFIRHLERTRETVELLLNEPITETPVPWDQLQNGSDGNYVQLLESPDGVPPDAGLFLLGTLDELRGDLAVHPRLGALILLHRYLRVEYQVRPDLVTSWFRRFGDLILLVPRVTPDDFKAAYNDASVEGQLSLAPTSKPFWHMLRPDINPEARPFWTEAYTDVLGKGLTVTYAAPVREDGAVTGIVGTDITLDRLSSLLRPPMHPGGRFLLVDREGEVLAAPGGENASSDVTADFDELLPPDKQAETHMLRTWIPGTPWELLWVMDRTDLLVSALPETIVPVLLLALLAALVMTGHLLVRRRFVQPAIALVQHISAETGGELPDPPDVPREWRRWFDALNDAYRIRAAAENLPGVVARFRRLEGGLPRLEFAGRGWEALIGVPPGTTFESVDPAAIIHPDDLEHVLATVAEAIESRESFTVDHRIPSPSGEERWLRFYASPPTDEEGTIFDSVLMDVTAEHQAEETRRRLETRIQQAQKAESLGILAGGVAHDFNNILMGMIGSAELTEMELPEDSPLREHQQEVIRSGHRAAELAHQMLAYAGRGRLTIESLSVDALLRDLWSLFEASVPKKIEFSLDSTPGLPIVDGDSTQLRQVMMNLVINAAEAIGDASGTIALVTEVKQWSQRELQDAELGDDLPPARYISVLVRDTGCGMDEETRQRVFDPFFSTKFLGRGLGLASVLGIVRCHGGGIAVTSSPDRGTTFRVLLPVAEDLASPITTTPFPTRQPTANDEIQGIALLVDDEPVVRKVAGIMLRNLGFEVLVAENGVECLDLLATLETPPTVILLDYSMPRLDGLGTLRQIRVRWPGVPVILCSGYDAREMACDDKTTADAYLQKPIRLGDLSEVIRSVLR